MSKIESNWIKEGLLKRKAQFSTVIIYETADPKRVEQFINFIKTNHSDKIVYRFINFRGLLKKDAGTDSFEVVQVDDAFSTSTKMTLAQSLEYIDNIFNIETDVETGITFIIEGVFREDNSLTTALRTWAFDYDIYSKKHTVVLFTEDAKRLFDDNTLKYFIVIKVPYSLADERREVITKIITKLEKDVGINLKVTKGLIGGLIETTKGLNLHEIESVTLESILRHKAIKKSALAEYKTEIVKKAGILDIESRVKGFESIGGYQTIKEFIKDNIIRILRDPSKAEKLGLRPPRGLLLFGMGGTGKTIFAKALANELQIPFLRLRTEKIVSKWYGETEQLMAKALELSEEIAPVVLFIDEIDRFGQRGQIGEHEVTRRSFSILLEWLGDENRKTIVIGTTNRIQDLDRAFIRVGRFDYIIPMLLPDRDAREQILAVHTSIVRKVPLKEVNLRAIAERTEGFTGAELEELVMRASRNALKTNHSAVTVEDFKSALATFRVNKEQRNRELIEYLRLAEEYCNDAQFLQRLKDEVREETSDRISAFKKEFEL